MKLLSVFLWRTSEFLQENLRKIAQMVEAAGGSDIGDAVRGVTQKCTAYLHAVSIQIGDRRLLHVRFEHLTAFASSDISCCGNILQLNILRIVCRDICNHFFLQMNIRIL